MIKSIRLQNFFGFRDCTINLEKGENVLVGINGSGKSNFFKAILLLRNAISGIGIQSTVFDEFLGVEKLLFSQPTKDGYDVTITYELDAYDMFNSEVGLFYQLTFVISKDKRNYYLIEKLWKVEHDGRHDFISRNSSSVYLYENGKAEKVNRSIPETESCLSLFKESHSAVHELSKITERISMYFSFDLPGIKYGTPYRIDDFLLSDGRNLGQLLHNFSTKQKSVMNFIIGSLKQINPNFTGIDFETTPSAIHLLLAEKQLESATPAVHISDGTLRFLCLMAILYNPNRGSVVCIDEPEIGLHPDMINTLYRAIQYAAETSQIIISTHSAHLLDYFNLENVRVFEKDDNNATIVEQFTEEDFKGWYKQFNPGEMWRAGDIGGKRW